jgi:hypothetical protein
MPFLQGQNQAHRTDWALDLLLPIVPEVGHARSWESRG